MYPTRPVANAQNVTDLSECRADERYKYKKDTYI